jgi:hypothetical protein
VTRFTSAFLTLWLAASAQMTVPEVPVGQSTRTSVVTVTAPKGSTLPTVAADVIEIAGLLGRDVVFVFNGVELTVSARDSVEAIEKRWELHRPEVAK